MTQTTMTATGEAQAEPLPTWDGTTAMIVFAIPEDDSYLEALGTLAMRHAHLEHVLRMTIKTITGRNIPEALAVTARRGADQIRKLVVKEASCRLHGDANALAKLEAILLRGQELSWRRNDFVHSPCARYVDGPDREPFLMVEEIGKVRLPSPATLLALATEIGAYTVELNEERLHGFIAVGLAP